MVEKPVLDLSPFHPDEWIFNKAATWGVRTIPGRVENYLTYYTIEDTEETIWGFKAIVPDVKDTEEGRKELISVEDYYVGIDASEVQLAVDQYDNVVFWHPDSNSVYDLGLFLMVRHVLSSFNDSPNDYYSSIYNLLDNVFVPKGEALPALVFQEVFPTHSVVGLVMSLDYPPDELRPRMKIVFGSDELDEFIEEVLQFDFLVRENDTWVRAFSSYGLERFIEFVKMQSSWW